MEIRLTRQQADDRWERLCDPSKGCQTACCYHHGSPCEFLRIIDSKVGQGVCRIYPMRFGKHQTVAGEEFICAPMSHFLKSKPAPSRCGYAVVQSVDGVPVIRGQV